MWLQKHQYQFGLTIILIIAATLRFYNFFTLPYMWDELSAISRLQFNSFSELIEKGVKPDGHPAGVQVFLYYWTLLFGRTEWIVKLPFNLMGLASIYLIFKIGQTWFGDKSGVLAASFMATLQFFVLYSPVARPYISGLFLTLMMVHYWSLYMFQNPSKKFLAGFIIFAALSAYNHHFSLLFAAIIGFSGLFTIHKSQVKEYIISGILIFTLYLPHMPVFIHQLGIGGIGGEGLWLNKPNYSFPLEFIDWAFQFSSTILILVAAFFAYSIFGDKSTISTRKTTKNTLLISWFLLPITIGLGYSLYINPVIQYSMLIYSFPYLLLLIGSGIEKMKWWSFYPSILLIIILNTFNLIENRKHYEIIFKQPFDITAQMLNENNNLTEGETFIIFNTIEDYQTFYFAKYEIKNPAYFNVYKEEISSKEFSQIISARKEDFILASGVPSNYIPIIQQYYPNLTKRVDGYTVENYLFSKSRIPNILKNQEITTFSEESNKTGWKFNDARFVEDSLANSAYEFKEKDEWGLSYSDSISKLKIKHGVIIEVIAEVICDTNDLNSLLVGTIQTTSGETIWRGAPMSLISTSKKNHYKAIQTLDSKILVTKNDWNNSILNLYIWNKDKESFKIHNIEVSTRANNPIRYGLFNNLQ
ncbi:hypothetical protein HNS38_05655 [Lentimicrobium sp. L6]|uniref:glycosyltransferase family 39 protein n=1 Tax=Lentimicrobium sp. L6 TaxID=2735916 RepID=UPI0015544457|nr:glycosyltransferase family 39 protein [Lentimicrobium sp. L6]NPD84230.1 hypothetical protein [Lentimicrobium sp. L6]